MNAVAAPPTWGRRAGSVAALVVAACFVPGDGLTLFTALAVLVSVGCGVVRSWAVIASGLLPATERGPWRSEVRAVLDAAPDGRERRRQLCGFLLGLPTCVLTSWRLTIGRR